MKIDRSQVEHVAELARLQFNERQLQMFVQQLNEILNYFDKLQDLDTGDVEPTAHLVGVNNAFRSDEVKGFADNDLLLRGAPAVEGRLFRVPRIIE